MHKIKYQGRISTPLPEYGDLEGPLAGLPQGNGDIFTSYWNLPEQMIWNVGKTDVWDRRYFGDSKRVVTLKEIKQAVFASDAPHELLNNIRPGLPGSAHWLYRAYDFPCPKPVGQIILHASAMFEPESSEAELDQETASLTIEYLKADRRCHVQSRVLADRNIIVLDVAGTGLDEGLTLELYRHQDSLRPGQPAPSLSGSYPHCNYDYAQDCAHDTGQLPPPEVGSDGDCFWVRQRFPAESTFPHGFEYVMMVKLVGAAGKISLHENILGVGAKVPLKEFSPEEWNAVPGAWKEIHTATRMVNDASGVLASVKLDIQGDFAFSAIICVMTTRDCADPFKAAKDALLISRSDLPGMRTEHDDWWRRFWSSSSVSVDHKYFNQQLVGQLYHLGWSRRVGKVPLYNSFRPIFADASPWHGDYHFNEMWLHQILIANHGAELLPWMEMLEEMLPMAQNNAREVYGCRGCCYTLCHYPIKTKRIVYANQVWELGIDITGMILQVFWQYYRYTGDIDFLRTRAYPILREAARFYADYVNIALRTHRLMFPDVRSRLEVERPSYMATLERRLGLPRKLPFMEIEDLLMSCTGRIYLFPGFEDDGGFERLLAMGGFEISAHKRDGIVAEFLLKSLAGNRARFKNPWHPAIPIIHNAARLLIDCEIDGDSFAFETKPEETYSIHKTREK